MTAIPAKLYEAFEKIRLGRVDEGVRLFDRIEGFEAVKAVPLAELCYFRHDWKYGRLFAQDIFEADLIMESSPYRIPHYAEQHLQLYLVGTCQLGCWKESREFLEKWKKTESVKPAELRKHCRIQEMISLIADPENTARKLLEARPMPRLEGKRDLDSFESKIHFRRTIYDKRKSDGYFYDHIAYDAYRQASSKDHVRFYENHFDRFENMRSHLEAAKSYIALENVTAAKEAIRRYMRCWEFKEPFQVAPIILFTDYELWPIMSDRRFTESLLTIPHHRES